MFRAINDIRNRFPAFKPTPATVGVLEKEAGILYPEECIRAFLDLAARNGATIKTADGSRVAVKNSSGVTGIN